MCGYEPFRNVLRPLHVQTARSTTKTEIHHRMGGTLGKKILKMECSAMRASAVTEVPVP